MTFVSTSLELKRSQFRILSEAKIGCQ